MKVTVIVPVYNAAPFLPRCLDSLCAQTLDDYELLLIDDGSTDASPAILEDYRVRYPEKIRVLRVENGGQGRARNRGLELARGDYIGFADSDDWVEPDMFEALWTACEREGAELAACDALEESDDGAQRYMPFSAQETALKSTAVWNKLARRELFEGLRFAEGRLWYEDLPVAVGLVLRAGKLALVPRPLYHYRRGHCSTMNNRNAAKNLDLLSILDSMRADVEREAFESLVLNHLLIDAVKRVQAMARGEERSRVLRELRAYARREIPRLAVCPAYRAEPRGRRLAMWLNYHGLEDVSAALLAVKTRVQ